MYVDVQKTSKPYKYTFSKNLKITKNSEIFLVLLSNATA